MSGLGRVLVGYRKNDRRRLKLIDDFGVAFVQTRVCAAGCGYPVFVNMSGLEAMRDKDPEVLCEECASLYRVDIERTEL